MALRASHWRQIVLFISFTSCARGFIIQRDARRCNFIAGETLQSKSFSSLTDSRHQSSRSSPTDEYTALSTRLFSSTDKNTDNKNTSKTYNNRRRGKNQRQQRDVVIIGGGLAGLSAALYLTQIDASRHVTILDREDPNDAETMSKTAVGSMAAAGMLAPQSERLPPGPLLDLCLASRSMYSDFCDLVESLARESGSEGFQYLTKDPSNISRNSNSQQSNGNDGESTPWSVGYMHTGGFLAPAMAGDSVATWAPPSDSGTATWLDATQVRELEPNLHPNVIGGWWFPQDASVDARRLTKSLRAACIASGVQLLLGSEYEISSLDLMDRECRGVWLQSGMYLGAKTVLVANGAWMRNLLPVPLQPHKGQSLSLRMPADRPPLLRRVIFAQDSYIVPKADGRIVIGATVEAGSFDSNVTPAGLLHILSYALELVPGLKDLPIEETWAGLRPTTPDKGPILGQTPWNNLFVAGGYWRNGVLLAPKTGELIAQLIAGEPLSMEDEAMLKAFAWDRFTETGGGAALAANARYAASMHPIHSRTTGFGVAAAVGTELGSYSTARSAATERGRDRASLFGSNSDSDDSFERAAQMGQDDSLAFTFGDTPIAKEETTRIERREHIAQLEPYEGSADAWTVPAINYESELASAPMTVRAPLSPDLTAPIKQYNEQMFDGYQDIQQSNKNDDRRSELQSMREAMRRNRVGSKGIDETLLSGLLSQPSPAQRVTANATAASPMSTNNTGRPMRELYQQIKENKAKQVMKMPTYVEKVELPDPGFRIYYKIPETGEQVEVPPYTSPGEFQDSLKRRKDNFSKASSSSQKPENTANGDVDAATIMHVNGAATAVDTSGYSEKTFDGYQAIQELNSRTSRDEELQLMKEARRRNRLGQKSIDMSKIGAVHMDEDEVQPC
ncbi:hypothetical protein MPSEU_000247500 [Mayamaea pseudoterrestris]|nr:hypothetical protein MPSEU_000247500 [Mayamaea pseudoterrestris]